MIKIYTIIAIFAIALALVSAEPPRLRHSKHFGNVRAQSNRKAIARQEEAPDTKLSPAPYPPAGMMPEIPFELPSEIEVPMVEPDQTYGPPGSAPDETYGPPKPKPDQTYGLPELTPDQTYGPPKAKNVPVTTGSHNTFAYNLH